MAQGWNFGGAVPRGGGGGAQLAATSEGSRPRRGSRASPVTQRGEKSLGAPSPTLSGGIHDSARGARGSWCSFASFLQSFRVILGVLQGCFGNAGFPSWGSVPLWGQTSDPRRERASGGAGRPGAAFPLFSPCSFLLFLSFFFLPVTRSVPRGLATLRQRLVALEGCRLKLYEEEGEKMGHWEQLPATSNPAPALPLYCLGRNSAAEGKNQALFTHFSAPPARALSFSPCT